MKSKPEWLKQGLQEQKLKKSTDLLLDTESERLLGPPVPPLACLVHSSYFCTGVATAAWPAGGRRVQKSGSCSLKCTGSRGRSHGERAVAPSEQALRFDHFGDTINKVFLAARGCG